MILANNQRRRRYIGKKNNGKDLGKCVKTTATTRFKTQFYVESKKEKLVKHGSENYFSWRIQKLFRDNSKFIAKENRFTPTVHECSKETITKSCKMIKKGQSI